MRVRERPVDYSKLVLEELNYGSYLQLDELLRLQEMRSHPPHHDEMFFIIIHQSFELWFKELLHETDLLIQYFRKVQVSRALKVVKRMSAILECLTQQIQLIGTLTPVEFAGFREKLGTGSGFQSVQFREMEFAFGLRDTFFLQFFERQPESKRRLEARLAAPSVYEEFLRALAADGCDMPEGVLDEGFRDREGIHEGLVETFARVYRAPDDHYHWVLVFEALVDLDMLMSKWRSVHALAVSRTIGGLPGTGGSEGQRFLASRVPFRFFPELWEVRNRLFDSRREATTS